MIWSDSLHLLGRALRRFPVFQARPMSVALQHARIIAFVVSRPDEAKAAWIRAAERRGAVVDVFSLGEPVRRAGGQPIGFVSAPPRTDYDCIVVSPQIDLFEHCWSYAFLDRLNALAAREGTIVLPKGSDPASGIRKPALVGLFGSIPEEETGSHLTFRRAPGGLNRPCDAAHSTLDAYWPLMETLTHGIFDRKLADVIRELGATTNGRPPREVETDLAALVQSQAYRTCSARTKAAMAEYIMSVYFPGRDGLRFVDLGAGTGLNSLELLLNPGPVSTLTLVEPRRSYHWHIAAVVERIRPQMKGDLFLVDRKVEEFEGPENDVGMVCAVLPMLPLQSRQPFLARAWKNLAPGGILMVLENMRTADAVRGGKYNDQRCTPREIDALLGQYAPIRYFMSAAKRELPSRLVGNQTVFRVIQKPH